MIDVVKMTPKEYSDKSRDYQVLARLYTALFNISKMYADDLEVWNPDIDNKLITLRSRTINFVNRHQWDLNDLEAITSCFKYLVRRKGTEEALEACINILLKVRGIDTGITIDSVIIDRFHNINIWIANDNILVGIIEDLVRYLIPTGITYRIYNYDLETLNAAKGIITDIYYRQDCVETVEYPFNKSMLVSTTSEGELIINGRNYGPYITSTFIYDNSEGEIAVHSNFMTAFILTVDGRRLIAIAERDQYGQIISDRPMMTYDPDTGILTIGGVAHLPTVEPIDDSEGTYLMIWDREE